MKKLLLAAAALGATLSAGTALAQDGSRAGNKGPVTRAKMIAQVDAQFAKMDADGDGMISMDERKAAAQKGKRGARMGKRGNRMAAMHARLDTNGDGMVSLEEHRAMALRRFDMVDANHDGTVDQAERAAAREKMMGKRKGGADGDMGDE